MSIIYYDEITTTPIDTPIRVVNKLLIKYVRVHIYMSGILPSSEMSLSIVEGGVVLKEITLTHDQLNNITPDAALHGFVKFDTDIVLNHDTEDDYTEYTLRLKMNNYTRVVGVDIGLVTTIDIPITELYDSNSEYARGYELHTYNII